MSEDIAPLKLWPQGVDQPSVSFNENALRIEALSRPAIGVANDAAGTENDGDMYIVGNAPIGAFAEFSPNDIALIQQGSWHAWAPVSGIRLVIADERMLFDGSAWVEDPAGGGGGGGGSVVDVATPSNVSGTVTLDFDERSRYVGAITLSANVTTLAFSNLPGAGKYAEYEMHITQDGTGGRTFAIPSSHKALGGSDTSIASAANAVTVLTASTVDNGTTWRYAMQESA